MPTVTHDEAAKNLLAQVREVREHNGEPPTWVLEAISPEHSTDVWVGEMIARAQVHATLHLAEVTERVAEYHEAIFRELTNSPVLAGTWPRIATKGLASEGEHNHQGERS